MLCQGNSCFMWNQNDGPTHMWQTCRIRIKQHPTLCTHLNGIRHCPDTLVPLGGEGDAASITPTPLTHQHQLGLVQIGANKKSQRSELYEQLQLQRVSGENPKELVHITYPVLSVKEAADWPKKKKPKTYSKSKHKKWGKVLSLLPDKLKALSSESLKAPSFLLPSSAEQQRALYRF